jgi:hypothetical protein
MEEERNKKVKENEKNRTKNWHPLDFTKCNAEQGAGDLERL